VDEVKLWLRPRCLQALTKISDNMNRFGDWKSWKKELASLGRMPLTAVEMRRYVDAVKAHKKDVKEWEQRMTSKEIVNARCNAEAWPVPSDLNLEAWLDQLVEEQRPLRCVNAEVQVKSIRMEVLQATETPGTGCNLHLEDLTLGAATLDPSEQISRDPTDAFLLKAADEGKRKMEARLQLGTMQMDCEAPGSQAASVLRPCRVEMSVAQYDNSTGGREIRVRLLTQAVDETGLTATVSSRMALRLQRAWQGLKAAREIPVGTSVASVKRDSSSKKARTANSHFDQIRILFDRLDADHSGMLEKKELHELLESIYGRFMTPKEIKIAADQLLHIISKGKELVSFEELQEFFSRDRGERAHKGQVVLCLNELTKPVSKPKVKDIWNELKKSIDESKSYNSSTISASTLQLYWVRTLENYNEAKKLWKELWKDCLGVSLEPRFQQWVLRGETPAIDMWSDPAMSTRMLSWSKEDPETTVHLDIAMDGLSVRLADTQHASSVPRAKLDLKDVYLKGGIRRGSSGIAALESGLKGSLQLSAEYWNQSLGITEPFVEPWRLQLSASPHLLCLRAEEHLVLNLTPPLIQALSVASNSLADAKDEGVELRHTETPVAVWVYNCTLCDVRVAVRNPEGERSLAISGWAYQEPVALELATKSAPLSVGTSSGWVLEMEMELRGGWWVRQELPFSTTGRRILRVERQNWLCVTFSVDARLLAPIVSLSGIGLLENMTSSNLTVCLGKDSEGKEQTLELEPYQLWNAGIGGGYEARATLSSITSREERLFRRGPRGERGLRSATHGRGCTDRPKSARREIRAFWRAMSAMNMTRLAGPDHLILLQETSSVCSVCQKKSL
ncbi:Hypothetical protein (Fragment), partial [Durusdinium trenchii]